MIAHLRGILLEKHPNQAVVEAQGVGYDVTIPVSTFSALGEVGTEVKLRVHTHVREDAIALFGFSTPNEKALFEKLIGVSGIGPKLAITALSGLATAELVNAIRSGAVEVLVRIPGVGKKTAERIILELRDKLDLLGIGPKPVGQAAGKPVLDPVDEDVVSALINFGTTRAQAEEAVRKAKKESEDNAFEPLFRRALKLVR